MNELKTYWHAIGAQAKTAAQALLKASSHDKNYALDLLCTAILENNDAIIMENQKDLSAAQQLGLDEAFIDRLMLTKERITQMATGVREMINLPDPIGEISDIKIRPSGIRVGHMRVPLGVIGIIYESRPNVTIDAAALCLKAGNACILRGGSEAFHTNQFLAKLIGAVLIAAKLPENGVQIVRTTDRKIVDLMVTADQFIDVIIPRGGKSLVERIKNSATVPVIKHLEGICHTFVDESADIDKALNICDNAKTQRYAPCNAMETLLIHQTIAPLFLPEIAKIYRIKNVVIRGCDQTVSLLQKAKMVVHHATDDDWSTEYLAPIISIKLVDSMEAAITHINHYGSHHTDVIVSEHYTRAMTFLRLVDSACVMINASSRFCDGFEFGLGAEIGISTDKLHARGPVGLEGLTSLKYIVLGAGEIRC